MTDDQNHRESQGYGHRKRLNPDPIDPILLRRKRSKLCSTIFTSVGCIIFFVIGNFLVGVGTPMRYVPSIEIKSTPNVNVLNVSNYQLTANWDVIFWFRNTIFIRSGLSSYFNIYFSYDEINVLVFDDHHKPISNVTISPSTLSPKEEIQDVHATFENVTTVVDEWNTYDGYGNGTTTINTMVIARLESRKLIPKAWVEAKCNNLKVLFSSKSNITVIKGSIICNTHIRYQLKHVVRIMVNVVGILAIILAIIMGCWCFIITFCLPN